jgi:hypothetical protein
MDNIPSYKINIIYPREGTAPEEAIERATRQVATLAFMAAPHRAMSISPRY